MASSSPYQVIMRSTTSDGHWREGSTPEGLVVEAWDQGFFVGALIVMACITVAAMRKGVLLHKLILIEQLPAMPHGTFCFMAFKGYGWYVSSTATLLFCSYFLHNVVAWLKVKPFFVGQQLSFFDYRTGKIVQLVYWISLGLTIPVWIFNTFNNFRFNNGINLDLYRKARPYEFLVRDPWWLFTNLALLHVIGKTYGVSVLRLVQLSPRLGILLVAIVLAISFTVVDVVATILASKLSTVDGINPYWKMSLVFKCLTDAIMLDDFATELKRIGGNQGIPSHARQNSFQQQGLRNNDSHTLAAREANSPSDPSTTKTGSLADGVCMELEDARGFNR